MKPLVIRRYSKMYIFPQGKEEYQFEESNEKIGAIFVRHPSWKTQTIKKGQLNELPMGYETENKVTETEEGSIFYLSYIDFQRTHNTIHALETFVNAFKAGINPPVSVQKALTKGFQAFLESDGEKSLGSAFGFKNNKTSARRYFINRKMEERNGALVYLIAKSHYFFPQIPLSKLFSMVSDAIDEERKNNKLGYLSWSMGAEKTPLSPDALKKIFKKSGKEERYKNYFKDKEKEGELNTSMEAKRDFLCMFPYKTIPQELRDLHPSHNKPPSEKYMS